MRTFRAGVPWTSVLHSWTLLDSHDTARFRTVAGSRERQLVGVGLQMTTPGVPMVCAGDELGLEGDWGEDGRRHDAVGRARDLGRRAARRLPRARSGCAARARRSRAAASATPTSATDAIAYLRESPGERLLCLASRADHEPVRLPLALLGCTELETALRRRRAPARRRGRAPGRRPRLPHLETDVTRDEERNCQWLRCVFDDVDKVYDNGVQAVDDLSLDIHDGEFLVLVGPSGCGKTTALRMVAGLEEISDGTVSIGGRVVNDLTPKERDIAMVFQNYALYPHLSVAENIAFGLRLRKEPKDDDRRARRLGGEDARPDAVPRAAAEGALRRPAAAGGDGPGDRPPAAGVPDGRAALEPRREAARPDARRHREAPARPRHDDDLRHPRPGRGDDDGRPRRGDEPGRAAAGRHAAAALRPPGQPLRRRLHRHAADEPARGDARLAQNGDGRALARRPAAPALRRGAAALPRRARPRAAERSCVGVRSRRPAPGARAGPSCRRSRRSSS